MSVKNWNYYYKENRGALTKGWFVDNISLGVAVGLLWYALFQILEQRFPSYVEVEGLVLFLYVILLWLPGSGLLNRFGERANMLASIGGVAFPLGYIVIHHKKIPDGILEVANNYLYRFNPYQGTNLSLPAGEEDCVPYVMTMLFMILWMALWGMAHFLKTPILLVFLPVLGILLEFLVGISPEETGVVYGFVAAFVLMVPKGTKLLRQIVIVGLAVVSINVAEVVFEEEIADFSTGRASIENWWENFEFPVIRFDNFLQLDFVVNNEHIDNHKPNYTGKVVFAIRTDTRPSTSQYLRGFCATDYKDGSWRWNCTAFSQACANAGYSENVIAKIVSSNPFYILKHSITHDKINCTISVDYVSVTGDTVYVPYMFSYDSMDENYTFTGDYLVKKNVLDKKVEVRVGEIGDLKDLSIYTYYAKFRSSYDEMKWYNSVAEKYTKRRDDLACIDDAAYYIKNKVIRPTEETLWLSSQAIMYDEECLDALLENMYRMEVAAWVRSYLADKMDYSLDLDRLTAKDDPVEYALEESGEGYCMHYASAAVLIFKELGIPARYASGYIVRPSDYQRDVDSGQYVAEIEDYNGHAWAEIYLENIGWVPIEVTEGYSDYTEEIPTKKEPDESSESESSETESTQTPTEPELTEEPIDTEEPTEEPIDTEEPTETEPMETEETESQSSEMSGDNSQQGGGAGVGDDQEQWNHILRAALVLILVFGIIYVCKLLLVYYDYILKREVDGNHTRRAVKRMNKRIARIMRLTNWKSGQLTDARLEEVLKKNYPQVPEADWNRYMEIVKKMHYSNEQITHDEMMHVYGCYKNV